MNPKQKKREEADKWWGVRVFEKYGRRCLLTGGLARDPHHYIHKGNCSKLRYDITNGVPLAKGVHLFKVHSGDPIINKKLRDMLIKTRGEKVVLRLERIAKQWVKTPQRIKNSYLTEKYYDKTIAKLRAIK